MVATRTSTIEQNKAQNPKPAVEDMLREIAYVLHVTRKVRAMDWPVATPAGHKSPIADLLPLAVTTAV